MPLKRFYHLLLPAAALLASCGQPTGQRVVLYSSIDSGYTHEIAELFENESGIKVRIVSDTEATKSSGLLNRLIAEKQRPVADVFWSGDSMRSEVLASHNILEPYIPEGHYTEIDSSFLSVNPGYPLSAARLRMIMVHGKRNPEDSPEFLVDLAKPEFASRSCLANPLFGTSSMHAALLFELLGDEAAIDFFESFTENGGTMLSSNGEVKRRVASGEFSFGLTDSDDVNVALEEGEKVDYYPCGQSPGQPGVAIIPSAAVLIRNAPNSDTGRLLVDFLSSARVETAMAESYAAHFPLRKSLPGPDAFPIALRELEAAPLNMKKLASRAEELKNGFLRDWVERQATSSLGGS